MKRINIDIETRSSVDLKKYGAYRYAEAPDFQILLFGYSIDGGPVEVIDTSKFETVEDWPIEIVEWVLDPDNKKHAFNANFERVCLSRAFLGDGFLNPEEWHCTMIQAAEAGYGSGLDDVAKALNLAESKGAEGTRLINFFSKPLKDGTYNSPEDHPEKWEQFTEYNRQDVVVEKAIMDQFSPISKGEQRLYALDQEINDRGVLLDMGLVDGAVDLIDEVLADGMDRIRDLTGVANPNSNQQITAWLAEQGIEMDSLNKEAVAEQLKNKALPPDVRRYFKLRRATALASVKKYASAQQSVSQDGRLRGLFRFYGAHTGRWAGRALQPQNLPKGGEHDADVLRELVRNRDRQAILDMGISTTGALKDIIRTVMIPKPGHKFIVFDYSAIEAVVLAWLAGEERVLEVFRTHGKLYEANAAAMFRLDFDSIQNPSKERDRGKIATLACGYQGSVGAITAMGGDRMGLSEDEMLGLVKDYRRSNPKTVQYWWDVESAFKGVVGGRWQRVGPVEFRGEDGGVTIVLPSRRTLLYPQVELTWDDRRLVPSFIGKHPKTGRLARLDTYGGRLTENITQATARDFLALAMMRLAKAGYKIVLHVHDEVVVEVPESETLEEIQRIVEIIPKWATGLPLRASGFETNYYRKD